MRLRDAETDTDTEKRERKREIGTAGRATESLPFQTICEMSPWKARVFGSLCVSPYNLSTPKGEVALQKLAAGDLAHVTLQAADLTAQLAAFLAHFVARCCKKNEVRVKILLANEDFSEFILSPGGGLEVYCRKDTSQTAASAANSGQGKDRVLVLSNMDVDVATLHLLMEAALAGLKEAAAVPARVSAEISKTEGDNSISTHTKGNVSIKNTSQEEASKQSGEFAEKVLAPTKTTKTEKVLAATKTTKTKLTAIRTTLDGMSLDRKKMVESIELNQNPSIGKGKGQSMKLIIQIAHLTAGQYLLRLHLDNNNIEDEGMRVLADAFTRNRFAPRLQILWMSNNCITDASCEVFGEALEKSLDDLVDVSLFLNKFTTKGECILRQKTALKTSLTLCL